MSDSISPESISVVIPAFNAARFLADAVDSVRRQRPVPIEIIIVDDGSTDETPAVVARLGPPVRGLRQVNRGPAAARNAGFALARGQAIAFLDADDWWTADALEVLHAALITDPELDAAIGLTQVMTVPDGAEGISRAVPSGRAGLITTLGSTLIRRRALGRVGLFDETLPYGEEDVDWFLRAREAGARFATLSQVTLNYRRHDRNLTQDAGVGSRRLLLSLGRSLARRRAAGNGEIPLSAWHSAADPAPDPRP